MVRPKKHLGQHFLTDENIARKITGYINPEVPLVLEIGPGMGILSRHILAVEGIDPWFMEIDNESVEYLSHTFPGMAGRLIQADFLAYDLKSFPQDNTTLPGPRANPSPPFTIIGNFPYNISSQILFRLLENRHRIPELIGMFQHEVALRVAAPPGSRTYGILSVLLQAYYEIEYLFTVNESVFHPPPKVKSAVIRLRRNATEKLACDETFFIRLVKMAFNQRRKTLRNALHTLPVPQALSGNPVFGKRAEQLSVDDFVRLAGEISTFA